jgi:AbrB family looped-hinge helix DNA binding protein
MRASRAQLGGAGRLVIPAEYRRRLGIKPGDELMLVLEDDEVRILTPARALARAQELVGRYLGAGGSLATELIAERRQEAADE